MAGLILSLALQGGGAHGAFTWGVLDRLLEEELVPMGISGTSAGALNAVVMAGGLLAGGRSEARARLARLWHGIAELAPTPLANGTLGAFALGLATHLFSPYALNPTGYQPLAGLLEKLVSFPALRAAARPRLFIAATNARTGKLRLFENKDVSLDAVLASACLPQLHHAVEVGEEAFWDGGFTSNPPVIALAQASRAATILLVRINPVEVTGLPESASAIRNRIAEITFAQPLERELAELALLRRLARPPLTWLSAELRRIARLRVETIAADEATQNLPLATRLLAKPQVIDQLHAAGRAAAGVWLDGRS
jgi:NTE family protein